MDQPLPGETPAPENLQTLISQKEFDAIEKASTTDHLTGLLNRRGFKQAIDNVKKVIERNAYYTNKLTEKKKGFALLALDIDFFKSFNDTYGHDIGDAVLKGVSTFFTRRFRPADTICRWGGEEFVILLQGNNSSEFLDILNKRFSPEKNKELNILNFPLRIIEITDGKTKTYRAWSNKETELLSNEKLIVKIISFSGGLVSFAPEKDDLEMKMSEADSILYKAKNSGRDHIETPGF